jgi:hypothetical protein
MTTLLLWIGRIAAVGGALLSAVAALARISGQYWIGTFQAGTVLQAGMAAMVAACLCFLIVLLERNNNGR